MRGVAVLGIAAVLFLAVNWVYQVVHKPTELLFPVSGTLYKSPPETWREYSSLFDKYSTDIMSPELLAALAQVEGSGNPIVRTYWRWSWVPHPFEVYRPASSAVGMYQLTDGTFAQAKHFVSTTTTLPRTARGTIGTRAGSTVSTCASFPVTQSR